MFNAWTSEVLCVLGSSWACVGSITGAARSAGAQESLNIRRNKKTCQEGNIPAARRLSLPTHLPCTQDVFQISENNNEKGLCDPK